MVNTCFRFVLMAIVTRRRNKKCRYVSKLCPKVSQRSAAFQNSPQSHLIFWVLFKKKLAQELSKPAQSSHTVDGVTSVASELMHFKDKYIHYL